MIDAAREGGPHVPKMVRVMNTHHFRSFYVGDGQKIGPGEMKKIPQSTWLKVKGRLYWLKRAERGDVI